MTTAWHPKAGTKLAPAHKLGQAMGLAGAASLIMNAIAPAVAEPIGARYGFAWVGSSPSRAQPPWWARWYLDGCRQEHPRTHVRSGCPWVVTQ